MKKYVIAALCFMALGCTKDKQGESESNSEDNTFIVRGSDTEYQLVSAFSKEFSNLHPGKGIYVSGGGTGRGIEDFVNGLSDIANASRMISDDEFDLARDNQINPTQVIIAVDAIAIITHPTLRVDSLSIYQVRDIFNGKITNWKEVGGPNKEIHLYGRTKSSGTNAYLRKNLLSCDFASSIEEKETSRDIIAAVKSDPLGIGYVGVGTLTDNNGLPVGNVWATYLYIEGGRAYSPYENKAVESGSYPLSRPLFQYFNGIPEGRLREFLKFELSVEGQSLVRQNGYFPINDIHRHLNSVNGILFK